MDANSQPETLAAPIISMASLAEFETNLLDNIQAPINQYELGPTLNLVY